MLMLLAWLVVSLLALPALYRAVLAIAYLIRRPGARPVPEPVEPHVRFLAIIPAHDEELLIGELIASIRRARYPAECIEILVIADNCTDRTADVVRAAGEGVVVRRDPENRGKGQALDWTLQRTDLSRADAVVFFDADNIVDPDFFRAMHSQLVEGHRCLQGYYGIANPDESLMTRLLSVTYVMKNLLFNGGKRSLGLDVVLMGTGMTFARDVVAKYGWKAMSIVEDLEQTVRLIEGGERIRFVPNARIRAQEAASLQQGFPQRQRWASGRRALYTAARRVIAAGLRERDLAKVDVGIDLLMPTYSKLLNASFVALALALLLLPAGAAPTGALALILAYQVAEVGVAMWLMPADRRFIRALVFAPVFLVWKATIDLLAVAGYRRDNWARTARAPHSETREE